MNFTGKSIMKFKDTIKFLKEEDDLLITSHINSDGDGIGAIVALREYLASLGKKCKVILNDEPHKKFLFLSGVESFEFYNEEMSQKSFHSVISIDATDTSRLGNVTKLIADGAKILNIDHHISNTEFGSVNLNNPSSSASSELVAELLKSLDFKISPNSASALYAGIVTDTERFRFDNTTATTFSIASWLIESGADTERVARKIYYTCNHETLIGQGKLLSSLKLERDGELAFTKFDNNFLTSQVGQCVDFENYPNLTLSIVGVEISFLLKEKEPGIWRINFRSRGKFDVNKLANHFGGGGHPKASGATIEGTHEEVKAKILEQVDLL